jgi:hypothetical protein
MATTTSSSIDKALKVGAGVLTTSAKKAVLSAALAITAVAVIETVKDVKNSFGWGKKKA